MTPPGSRQRRSSGQFMCRLVQLSRACSHQGNRGGVAVPAAEAICRIKVPLTLPLPREWRSTLTPYV